MYANVYCAQTRDPTDCMHLCSGINNESAFATVDRPYTEGSDSTAPVRGTTLTHALTHTHLPTRTSKKRERTFEKLHDSHRNYIHYALLSSCSG